VLERLGVKIDLESDGLRRCFERAGMCFVFAQKYHPVMARVGPLRRELGVPTLFNLLGPLCNAARPSRQLIGVSEPHRLVPMAEAAKALGVERALVVHGRDHVDEISVSEPTLVVEVREGRILPEREIKPEDFGMRRSARSFIVPNGPDEAIAMLKHALGGEPSPARDALVLNGGAAIYLAGLTDSLASGIASATELLSNGAPLDALEKLRQESNRDSQ